MGNKTTKTTKKNTETILRRYLPAGMSHLVVFFGGFFDETFKPVASFVDKAIAGKRYGKTTGILYFSWSDATWWSDFAVKTIKKVVRERPVEGLGLVGHSYGGHSAAKVAGKLDRTIHALVTVDAVSWESALLWNTRPDKVGQWLNSYAPGVKDSTDIIAGVGGHWGHESGADMNIKVTGASHGSFSKLFGAVEPYMETALGLFY